MIRRPVVLVHHGVDELPPQDDPRRLVVSPAHLESQIRLLKQLGYRFATAEEVVEGTGRAPLAAGTAVVTFDDGLLNNLAVATPLLERLGVRATFYLCPGMWGERHPYVLGSKDRRLDESGARELHDRGMELGSHSMSHPDLRTLDDGTLRYELTRSKAAIEDITGRPCKTFAYPSGVSDDRVERAAEAAGYELAFAWGPGPWRPYAAPRIPGPTRHGARRLALKMLGVRRRAR